MISRRSAASGGFWTGLSRVFAQLIQFAIFMLAARVMSPAEFGVFALVAAIAAILTQVSIAGWPEYIMQWGGEVFRVRQTLFVAIVAGLIFMIIGLMTGLVAPLLSDSPVVQPLILVLSICILFNSISSTYAGVMNWQNKLTLAALTWLGADIVQLVVSAWALLNGHGVMALAYGRLAGAMVASIIGFGATRVSPALAIDGSLLRELSLYSWHIVATRLLANIRVYAATFIIGSFMGAASVGFYRAAQRLVVAFEEIVSEPTRILAWSLFRKSRDEMNGISGFTSLSQRFFGFQLYVAAPLFIGISLMAEDLTRGALGPDWGQAVPVVQLLAIAALVRSSGHASIPILSLARQSWLLPPITLAYSAITIAFICIGAQYGLQATALSEVVAAVIVFVINIWIKRRYANIDWILILRKAWPVIPALTLALASPLFMGPSEALQLLHPLLRFVLLGLGMIAIMAPVLVILDRDLRQDLRHIRSNAD